MSDGIYKAKPIDWTCPNCGHESPSRTFPIIEKLEKQNEILREAVEFYANEENTHRFNPDFHYQSNFDLDSGKRARAALEKIKQGEGE